MSETNPYTLTPKEYKSLFDSMYASLCTFADTYVKNLDISKDIVQDVFVKIWENKIEFINENSVKSYLYNAIKNKSLDYLKSQYVRNTDTFSMVDVRRLEEESFFLNEVVISEVSNIIQNAISTLPPKCATILKLSLQNYKNEEIATQLGISVNTVKAQKKIAYKRLKPMLESCLSLITYILYNSN